MSQQKAVAYIPEFQFSNIKSRIEVAKGLYILPKNDKLAVDFYNELTQKYTLNAGSFLYFEGSLKDDGTLFEIFQGYALSLTFFNPKGRATCRALKDLMNNTTELFIDEFDKFGYEKFDTIRLTKGNIKIVAEAYSRVEAQLQNSKFNPLQNTLEFFNLFLKETKIRTRLLYLSICLESILLEGETEGLQYKLGMRCAHFLNKYFGNVNMSSIFQEIKNSYILRSKIIHGDNYDKESQKIIKKRGQQTTELDHVYILEEIVKDILSLIFLNDDLYQKSINGNLGADIDTNIILHQ